MGRGAQEWSGGAGGCEGSWVLRRCPRSGSPHLLQQPALPSTGVGRWRPETPTATSAGPARAGNPCAAAAVRGPLSVSGGAAREGALTLGGAGLGPVPAAQTFSRPPKPPAAVGQTRAPRGRQDVARGMVRVQQLSWGDGALGAPWLSLTGGTETRPRVWGAFPIVPSTRGSHASTGRAGRPVRSARGRGVCSYSPLVCVCSLQCIFKIPKCRRSLSCGICSKMPSGCPRLWVEPSPVQTVVSCAQSCDGARV